MILLTSSIASVAGHLYKNFLADQNYKSVLFIDTAAEPEIADGDEWLQADLQSLKDQGYQVDRYTVTGKAREEIEKEIDKYDVIYMCGGNTAYLLIQLQKTDSFTLIKEKVRNGKPYIGTSAGSIVAGPELPDYFTETADPELKSKECFNFVSFIVVPHWGSEHFRDEYVGQRIKLAYKDTQKPLLLLTDKQYVYVNDDGDLQIINTE